MQYEEWTNMVKSRIGRKVAVCLDCGHEWLAKDTGTVKPPRCTSQPCRSRNVVWKDAYSAEELQTMKDQVRSDILALGGQPVSTQEPEPEPVTETYVPDQAVPPEFTQTHSQTHTEPEETEAEPAAHEEPKLSEPEPESARTNAPEKPAKKQRPAPKRSSSGKFAKSEEDKPDKPQTGTYSSDYPSFEEIQKTYKGVSPLFIYVLSAAALIGVFFFLRRKGFKLLEKAEPAPIQKEAEPAPFFVPRVGGGLF